MRLPFSVAVLLHGGYWQTTYGKLVMRPLALDLVGRGFAVWNLEYRRLGTGLGGGGGWLARARVHARGAARRHGGGRPRAVGCG